MIFAAVLLAGIPAGAMQSGMQQVPVADGVALFKRACFDPFPVPSAALTAIEDPALGLTKQIKTPTQAMQPGDAWVSPSARVTYVDAEWMPRNMGTPQCGVTVSLADAPQHLDVASAFAAGLGLPAGKLGKNGPSGQSRWDLPKADGSWRLFLSTQQTPSGVEMQAIMMNLRGKKK